MAGQELGEEKATQEIKNLEEAFADKCEQQLLALGLDGEKLRRLKVLAPKALIYLNAATVK